MCKSQGLGQPGICVCPTDCIVEDQGVIRLPFYLQNRCVVWMGAMGAFAPSIFEKDHITRIVLRKIILML